MQLPATLPEASTGPGFCHRCQSFSGSPSLCTQCEGGFVIHGVKSYYLLIGQWWEASLQGLQAVLGIPEVLDEPFACGIGLGTGVASLVDGIKLDQASVPVCTTRMSREGSLGWECFLTLVADPGFALGGLGTGQDAPCVNESGLESFEPNMLLCIRLAEAQASLGSFLEPPIPVGVQRHICDRRRKVCSICWGTGNLIKLQEPGKGGLAKG